MNTHTHTRFPSGMNLFNTNSCLPVTAPPTGQTTVCVSMLTATQHINVFDITSTLPFLHILLMMLLLLLLLWRYLIDCSFKAQKHSDIRRSREPNSHMSSETSGRSGLPVTDELMCLSLVGDFYCNWLNPSSCCCLNASEPGTGKQTAGALLTVQVDCQRLSRRKKAWRHSELSTG